MACDVTRSDATHFSERAHYRWEGQARSFLKLKATGAYMPNIVHHLLVIEGNGME